VLCVSAAGRFFYPSNFQSSLGQSSNFGIIFAPHAEVWFSPAPGPILGPFGHFVTPIFTLKIKLQHWRDTYPPRAAKIRPAPQSSRRFSAQAQDAAAVDARDWRCFRRISNSFQHSTCHHRGNNRYQTSCQAKNLGVVKDFRRWKQGPGPVRESLNRGMSVRSSLPDRGESPSRRSTTAEAPAMARRWPTEGSTPPTSD